MKHLITWVIFMTLGVNIVAAQKYFQNPETGELIIQYVDQPLQELDIQFDANVSSSIKEDKALLTKIMQNDTVELSIKQVKGSYDHFVVYYTLKTTSEIVYRNSDGQGDIRISYNPLFEQIGERQFAWWYLFWIMGLIAMLILQKVDNAGAFAFVRAFAGAFAFIPAFAFADAGTFAGVFVIVCAFAGTFAFAGAFADNKKIKNLFAILYYVCIIVAMVCAYYQI